jgi:uncharacterized protein (DUF2384 family)
MTEAPIADVQARFARIVYLLRAFEVDPIQWLCTPHMQLDEHAPIDVIAAGRLRVVLGMLENAYAGIPT